MLHRKYLPFVFLSMPFSILAWPTAAELTIESAQQLAVTTDPGIVQARHRAEATRVDAISQSQYPDPVISIGAQNLPVDTFSFDQEPMTQFRVAVRQMFPQGDSLSLKAAKLNTQADSMDAAARTRALMSTRQVRNLWLEVLYWNRAKAILRQDETLFAQLQEVTRSLYSVGSAGSGSGRGSGNSVQQQDVILAELELGRLQEKIIKADRQTETVRAQLSRWIGLSALKEPWPELLPVLLEPELLARMGPHQDDMDAAQSLLLESLRMHPMLLGLQRQVEVADQDIRLMQQQYKPAWGVELSYGYRDGANNDGSDRADFFSAMVNFSVPLFTGNRQDKSVQSAVWQKSSQQYAYDDRLQEMAAEVRSTMSRLQQTREQLALFETQIIARSRQQAESSLVAYQSAAAAFPEVMRAWLGEQKDRLDYERLVVSRLQLISDLQFYFFTQTPDWVSQTEGARP
jgi:outer membrane protein TolC